MGHFGKTGSGKSYAAQGVVERLIGRRQRVCVIDPTDDYWGLRLRADVKRPSGDEIPLSIDGAQKLVERLDEAAGFIFPIHILGGPSGIAKPARKSPARFEPGAGLVRVRA